MGGSDFFLLYIEKNKRSMKKYLLLLLLSLFVFTSCSDDDDEWDPVQWKSDLTFNEAREAHVDANGGTYLFTRCHASSLAPIIRWLP